VYQTWWFFALVGVGTLGLVLSFHRLRVERLRGHYLATLAERTRVARELHDSILQGMTATLMHLRGLRKRFGPGAAPAAAATVSGEIKDIEDVVAANIEETRQFVWDLREGKPPALALPPALTELAARVSASAGIDVRVTVEGAPVPLPRDAHHELMRISHEALTNAVNHAAARHIEVHLHYDEDRLRLAVRDDGRGFDPQAAAGVESGHFGLAGIGERAAMLGRFNLETRPGGGTTVEVIVNLKDLRDA
jgi:signal transduction histidine kinase